MSARHLLLLPAAATAVLALTACDATAASGPGETASPAAVPASADGAPGATPAVATKAPGGAGSSDCPTGTILQKLVELPQGQSFGEVQCVKGWAGATPQGPNTGDGVFLFHYQAGTGWKFYGDGSGYDCADLGLDEPAPFCISDPVTPAKKPPAPATPAKNPSARCPAAKTLEALVELPRGQSFGEVQCVEGWAGATPQGPNTGDGVYLFHFRTGTGWKYYGEGSGYDCADLGLHEPAPFCIS